MHAVESAGARVRFPDPDAIDCWLFDVDNTLYPASADLFGQIDRRMQAYISRFLAIGAEEARIVQKRLFHQYGTTLAGLMQVYHINPNDFLTEVHAIDTSVLERNPRLRRDLLALPGRKAILTNADAPYVRRVLDALGIGDCFELVHDIEAMAYQPKPNLSAYRGVLERLGAAPERSFFVDDMALNLRPAKELGLYTAWVDNGSERGREGYDGGFIDYELGDLAAWLEEMGLEEMGLEEMGLKGTGA